MKFPQDIQCIIDPIDNSGGIFISNLEAAQNLQTLKKHMINAVITVARGHILKHSQKQLPAYLYLPADDHQSFNISKYFQQTNSFLDKYTKRTNVLVHCLAGVSRSVTVVLAYLIKKYQYSLKRSFAYILNRRNKIHPNEGFLKQLQEYEKKMLVNDSEKIKDTSNFIKTFMNQSFNTTKNSINSMSSTNFYRPIVEPKPKQGNYLNQDNNYEKNLKSEIKRLFSPNVKYLMKNQSYKENKPINSNYYAMKKQIGNIKQNILNLKYNLTKSSSNKSLASSYFNVHSSENNSFHKVRYL